MKAVLTGIALAMMATTASAQRVLSQAEMKAIPAAVTSIAVIHMEMESCNDSGRLSDELFIYGAAFYADLHKMYSEAEMKNMTSVLLTLRQQNKRPTDAACNQVRRDILTLKGIAAQGCR